MSEEDINTRFVEGQVFSDDTFLSTSLSENEAFEGNVQIKIVKSQPGAKVKAASAHSHEKVLFRPGTKFNVTKDKKGDRLNLPQFNGHF